MIAITVMQLASKSVVQDPIGPSARWAPCELFDTTARMDSQTLQAASNVVFIRRCSCTGSPKVEAACSPMLPGPTLGQKCLAQTLRPGHLPLIPYSEALVLVCS